ncbi:hypothetical protein CRG98_022604 [Punica granatum]|uniref:Uncharacterized protein n=1 Tax=Punica granatum TaxID=22663 RepID=A0A2I0JL53_PUNGR|nr:hypothetical protein CRG98_022604 [Punica granatum]
MWTLIGARMRAFGSRGLGVSTFLGMRDGHARPRKLLTSSTVIGGGSSMIALTLSGLTSMPFSLTTNPNSFPDLTPKSLEVDQMIFTFFGLYNHVVDVDLYLFMHHVMKECDHRPLIDCPGIFETERHDLVAKRAPYRDERCFDFILLGHLNLIVSREAVFEGELRVTCCVIHQDVDMGQPEVVFRTGPVEVSIVDADSDFAILLFHRHDVRYPFRVVAYLQESRIYLLDNLLLNAKKKVSSLTPFKTRPDLEGAWFFCSAYVDLFD